MLTTAAVITVIAAATSCARHREAPGIDDRSIDDTIARIEAGSETAPLVVQPAPGKDASVTFLVRGGDGRAPRIVSDVTGWGEDPEDETFDLTVGAMTRVGSTQWYRLDTRVAPAARVEYLVVHGETDYRTDPDNPRRGWARGRHDISEFVTPDYRPPQELVDPPPTPAGTTVEATIDSRALGAPRRALVYLPPGYHDDGAYPVAVFHSGWSVAHQGEAPRILDWLIAHREIRPIVGLFLESYLEGDPDNHEGSPMRTFLTDEALAWLASRYGVTTRAEDRAVLGISYGAKDALDAAFSPAQAYRRVGLLIPGRRLTSADIEALARRKTRRLRVAILAGRYDQANLPTATHLHRAFTDAGHRVDFIEVPEGHNPSTWRNHLRDVLVSLFGRRD